MKVTVVDSGVGNIGAVPNMLSRLGVKAAITSDPGELRDAQRIILPGVGAFDAAVRSLRASGMFEALREAAGSGTLLLGLCLGMELLGDRSDEGQSAGLGLIPGQVVRFRFSGVDPVPRVPHMGWNIVRATGDAPLLRDLGSSPRFYFAHSFHFIPTRTVDVIGTTHYGVEFAAAIQRDNVMGVQFHPEKSHRFGLKLLENFVRL